MRVRHPRAGDGPGAPPSRVDVNGDIRTVDETGTFELHEGEQAWLRNFAMAHDSDPSDLVEESLAETCTTVKSDGDVCGRELPCPYHSTEDN